jgi:hypothetical protein
VPDQNGLIVISSLNPGEDIPPGNRDIRARVHEAASKRAHHGENLRGGQFQRLARELNANLGLRCGRRLRKEVFFLEVIFPSLARLI